MRSAHNISKSLKNLHVPTTARLDEKIFSEITKASMETENKKPTSNVWRIIMKTKITKSAAAVIIGIVVLLPLAYGATKIVQYFLIDGIGITVKNSDKISTEQDARNAIREFSKLYREGKAKEVKPGVWVVTLSNGEEFAYSGNNPELAGLSNDEIQKLREGQSLKKDINKQ